MGNRVVANRGHRAALLASFALLTLVPLTASAQDPAQEQEQEQEQEQGQDQKAWVAGEVRLNMRRGAGTEYKIIGSVSTNQAVTVLDEEEGWTRVELEGGKVGWLPAGYLTRTPPPNARLDELESQLAESRTRLDRAGQEAEKLRQENRALAERDVEQRERLSELTSESRELRSQERWRDWSVGAGILVIGMVTGAVLARASNRRRSSRVRL